MPNAQILAVTFLVGVPMWGILSTILALRQRAKRRMAEQTAINTAEQLKAIEERFKPITDQESELERLKQTAQGISIEIDTLRDSYREKKALYDQLLKQVSIFDDKLAFAEMGLYEPHFNFTDSELYKTAISENREAQKN